MIRLCMDPDCSFEYFALFKEDKLISLYILRSNDREQLKEDILKLGNSITFVVEKPKERGRTANVELLKNLTEKIDFVTLWLQTFVTVKVVKIFPETYKGTTKKEVYINRVRDYILSKDENALSKIKGLSNIEDRHTPDLLDSIGLGLFDLGVFKKGGIVSGVIQ